MTSRVRSVTFDTHNPYELAGFWLQVLNAPRPDVLRFMPSLIVSEAEIDRMADTLGAVLAA